VPNETVPRLADPHRHVGKTLDALLCGRMSPEETTYSPALDGLERVVDEQLAGGRVHIHRNPRRTSSNLLEGAGQLKRLTGDSRPRLVGVELPRSRDRKSDQHRGEGRHEEGNDDSNHTQRVVAITTATEQRHPADYRYCCAKHRPDGAGENVPVLDVGQFVARTPSNSLWSSTWGIPVVTATAAFLGLRPVANAFG